MHDCLDLRARLNGGSCAFAGLQAVHDWWKSCSLRRKPRARFRGLCKQFLHDILNEKKSLYFIPQRLVTESTVTLGSIPSSGARLLISLAENREPLKIRAKTYGFSFLSDYYNKNRFDHYYEEKKESKERAHNISNEVDLLRSLFPGP